mgnify:CR=1 FL=1
MRKGVHTATHGSTNLQFLLRYLFLAGVLLIWTAAGTALAQESADTPEQEPPAEPEAVAPAGEEAAQVDEQTQWEQQWHERAEDLTRRRDELAETARNLEAEFQTLEREQDERRGQLRDQLRTIQAQMREVDGQWLDLQRERLRMNYRRELEALEQGHRQRQPRGPRTPRPRPVPERMDRWRREVNENIDLIRQELAEIQKLRENEDNRWNEVHVNLRDMREHAQAFRRHLGATAEELEEVRAEQRELGERQARCAEQRQEMSERQTQCAQQQQELCAQIRAMDERMSALKQHCGATSEKLRRQVEQLCTDLQRMGQSVGRMEQERLETESGLKKQVEQLGQCTQQLREELARTQGALQMLLAEANRSTVGSAGLSWAW